MMQFLVETVKLWIHVFWLFHHFDVILPVADFCFQQNKVILESPIGVYLRREVFKGEADATLKKELYEKTVAGQSVDGSWGRKGLETETFLVLDALKNVGLI